MTDEQLGWDSTVVRDTSKPEGGYTIMIDGKTFRIIDILNDFCSFSLLGRATRAFLAEGPVEWGKVVIKDVWVDAMQKREHQIQQEIFADLQAANLEGLTSYFFEHILYGAPVSGSILISIVQIDGLY